MTREEFNKLNVYEKVKIIMNQPISELECRDQALNQLENYHMDFGFDDMENQVNMMARAYELIAEESGTDYGGIEMQNHIKGYGESLQYLAKDIQKLSEKYRGILEGYLRDFKSDMANIEENQGDTPNEDMENPELNESIKKIKSNFKRFL
jgi:hypothetical protein